MSCRRRSISKDLDTMQSQSYRLHVHFIGSWHPTLPWTLAERSDDRALCKSEHDRVTISRNGKNENNVTQPLKRKQTKLSLIGQTPRRRLYYYQIYYQMLPVLAANAHCRKGSLGSQNASDDSMIWHSKTAQWHDGWTGRSAVDRRFSFLLQGIEGFIFVRYACCLAGEDEVRVNCVVCLW